MFEVTSAQLDAWIAALMLPLGRVLGMVSSAPLFSNSAVPIRVRVAFGIAAGVAIVPAIPPLPPIDPGSGLGIAIFVQQIVIGVAIGFVMRLVFSAVDLAGELIGLQMGLSFATFFDPDSNAQTAVLAEFMSLLASLIFLALGGHLMMIETMVHSFEWMPIRAEPIKALGLAHVAGTGALLFAAGLLLALPLITALLITNIAMGVLTRAAPQINLFAVGFPITLTAGFVVLMLSLEAFGPVMQMFYDRGFETIATMLQALN
ncbi:flagellar biosynthetic protein FliR [Nitrogeniibacter mangrovi]|uniref:Flagellar biosynthetic protein FliR n=1 Tax=Nitrogeniibacter mangrovi TaxID=2016596 RepID=A0A6C1B4M8_9RHOO|nr:flagellar biosynthetic protein FliR [Nitrogeniibacter mangrovi]QID17240.1 flagellar biosynthetic protein FliR [Nitrogeniibacter mangrovi]